MAESVELKEQIARVISENVMAEAVWRDHSVGEELVVTGIMEAADAILALLSAAPVLGEDKGGASQDGARANHSEPSHG